MTFFVESNFYLQEYSPIPCVGTSWYSCTKLSWSKTFSSKQGQPGFKFDGRTSEKTTCGGFQELREFEESVRYRLA